MTITINGETLQKIKGYSNEIVKLTGNLKNLKEISTNATIPKLELVNKNIGSNITNKETTNNTKNTPNNNTLKENIAPNQESFNLWTLLRQKIEEIGPAIQKFKQSLNETGNSKNLELVKYKISEVEEKLQNAQEGKIHLNTKEIIEAEAELERLNNKKEKLENGNGGNFFSGLFSSLKKTQPSMNQVSGITVRIKNQIKQWGSGIKQGIGHVLKYAMALFSLRGIYSVLSGCASSWLSSQNAGAKQLSANINYMKYAMGSALAPIIQFVTNLVYQLMKAIQSVAYALTGVNIFAKASASSYASMAENAKKTKNETKQLAGIHNEINNIQSNNNSDSGSGGSVAPSFDLSKMENTPNSIIDSIKNGNWYEVGSIIGQKLNEAMNSIPWDKIQSAAKSIGTNIAQFLNGFIETTDWKQVGNTVAQGLNTAIYLAQSFVDTFNWSGLGSAVANAINGFYKNTNWGALGDTTSTVIKGALDGITAFFKNFDWSFIIQGLSDFCQNIDWNGIVDSMFEMLGSALASFVNLGMIIGEKINIALDNAKDFFKEKIQECGGNVVEGIFKGIVDAIVNIGQWINEHIFQPFIDGFKNVFGIHSPSTVMAELGNFIMQGLLNGITSLIDNVKQTWEDMKSTAVQKFTDIKNSISSIWQQVTNKTSETWQNIKNKVKDGAQGAWSGITSIFGNIPNWFKDKFSQAWQAVKNVFSTGGRIFDGIKEGILSGLKSIVNAIISGMNRVISIPFNGLNVALRKIRNINIMGLTPFNWLGTISVPQIPQLAKGGVLTEATTVLAGEYSGARTNPEIVTPQNIMRDTFEDVFSEYLGNNGQAISLNLTVNVSNKKLGQILLDDLRDKKRRTGKDIEALVGG